MSNEKKQNKSRNNTPSKVKIKLTLTEEPNNNNRGLNLTETIDWDRLLVVSKAKRFIGLQKLSLDTLCSFKEPTQTPENKVVNDSDIRVTYRHGQGFLLSGRNKIIEIIQGLKEGEAATAMIETKVEVIVLSRNGFECTVEQRAPRVLDRTELTAALGQLVAKNTKPRDVVEDVTLPQFESRTNKKVGMLLRAVTGADVPPVEIVSGADV